MPQMQTNASYRRHWNRFALWISGTVLLQAAAQAAVCGLLRMLSAPGWLSALVSFTAGAVVFAAAAACLMRRLMRKVSAAEAAVSGLSKGEAVHLEETGTDAALFSALARDINRTSALLQAQTARIGQRDRARLEWIRSISHDVRTPLSMVLGYAALLVEDETLTEEQRQSAAVIEAQGLRMKELIDDLNLTSKLEYHMQPLRKESFRPAALLREVVSSVIDGLGSDTRYDVSLIVLPEYERLTVCADKSLMQRVAANILGNAIRHNPDGCSVLVLAFVSEGFAVVDIRDDGSGIPEPVSQEINVMGGDEDVSGDVIGAGLPHIMGMRIAKQCMLAHGGNLVVLPDRHTVELILPAGAPEV